MSDTNRVALRYIAESVHGTTPATPAFRQLRYSGSPTLAFVPETVISEEIRDDRQVTDLILVGGETTGEVNAELTFRNKDPLFEGLFHSTFQTRYSRVNTDGATEITAVDANSYTVTASSVLVLDDIIRAEGFTNAANNGFKFVDSGATTTDVPIQGAGLTVETPPATARIHLVGRRAATSDIVAAITPNRITSTVLDFTTLGLAAGDWIKLRGTGGTWPSANNDYYRILTVAANSIVFDVSPAGFAADGGASATVEIYFGDRLVNGVAKKSFTLEQEFADHSPVTYQYLNGMFPGGYTLTATAQEIVTEAWRFLGMTATIQDSGRFAGATTLAAQRHDVMNASTNVARLAIGGTPVSGSNFVTELTFEVENNLRELEAVGSLYAVGIGVGEFGVTGSLNTYFDNKTNVLAVLNNTETSVDARFTDSDSHVYLLDLPRVKFSEGSPEVPGKNNDTVANLGYRAFMHETLGYTAKLTRFHGVQ